MRQRAPMKLQFCDADSLAIVTVYLSVCCTLSLAVKESKETNLVTWCDWHVSLYAYSLMAR